MPRFDGTGPLGTGPGTGWGLGPCGAGIAWRKGKGLRAGFGWRRLLSYCPMATLTKKEEKEILAEEAAVLEKELKAIKTRLAKLGNEK